MSARTFLLRSSSIKSDVIGSELAGGGSRAINPDEDEEDASTENGARGVDGRGAAAGAERSADSLLSWVSVKSATRIWSKKPRRAIIFDDVWCPTPLGRSRAQVSRALGHKAGQHEL